MLCQQRSLHLRYDAEKRLSLNIKNAVFRYMTPCSLPLVTNFSEKPTAWDGIVFRNFRKFPSNYTVSRPERQQFSDSLRFCAKMASVDLANQS
jgi:hypothetical protein